MGRLPRPRAATSVAVMMGLLPFLNSCMDSTPGVCIDNGYSKTSELIGCLRCASSNTFSGPHQVRMSLQLHTRKSSANEALSRAERGGTAPRGPSRAPAGSCHHGWIAPASRPAAAGASAGRTPASSRRRSARLETERHHCRSCV